MVIKGSSAHPLHQLHPAGLRWQLWRNEASENYAANDKSKPICALNEPVVLWKPSVRSSGWRPPQPVCPSTCEAEFGIKCGTSIGSMQMHEQSIATYRE